MSERSSEGVRAREASGPARPEPTAGTWGPEFVARSLPLLTRRIHDGLGQQLSALGMGVHWLRTHLADVDAEVHATLNDLNTTAAAAAAETRALTALLHQTFWSRANLSLLIAEECRSCEDYAGLRCAFADPQRPRFGSAPAILLLQATVRTVLTTLAASTSKPDGVALNAQREADGWRLTVTARPRDRRDHLGRCFDQEALVEMRERIEAAAGSWQVDPAGPGGWMLTVRLPDAAAPE